MSTSDNMMMMMMVKDLLWKLQDLAADLKLAAFFLVARCLARRASCGGWWLVAGGPEDPKQKLYSKARGYALNK